MKEHLSVATKNGSPRNAARTAGVDVFAARERERSGTI